MIPSNPKVGNQQVQLEEDDEKRSFVRPRYYRNVLGISQELLPSVQLAFSASSLFPLFSVHVSYRSLAYASFLFLSYSSDSVGPTLCRRFRDSALVSLLFTSCLPSPLDDLDLLRSPCRIQSHRFRTNSRGTLSKSTKRPVGKYKMRTLSEPHVLLNLTYLRTVRPSSTSPL